MALPSYGSGLDSRQNLFSALPLQDGAKKRDANGKIRFATHLCFSASRTCSGSACSKNDPTHDPLQAKPPKKEKQRKKYFPRSRPARRIFRLARPFKNNLR